MTDFSSYFLTIFLTKKNLQYFQKSQIFDFKQNNKSVSFRAVRILNAGFNDKKILIALLIKEFLNSK